MQSARSSALLLLRILKASGLSLEEDMSEFKQLSGQEGMEKLGNLIEDIRIAMMTTAAGDGSFDSRPMATQKKKFDGTLWFLTPQASEKVREIADDAHVSLLYADPSDSKYVSVKGRGFVSKDKQKIHELWNPMYQAWFPGGEDDPQITVLRVDVTEADYWEASGSKLVRGIKYLAAAATKGKVDVGEAGTVHVSR
jgi:general stress protein 26